MRVALFITCISDTLFPATGRAVVALLERLGCEVVFPQAQTCCGQMHGNTGYADLGEALVGRWERVFDSYELVVSPSASCVGFVLERVPASVGSLFEMTEFLVDRLGGDRCGCGAWATTSDTERDRVEGVHGPRTLDVLVVIHDES